MITSTGNTHIRAVSALMRKRAEREAQGAFVIEGLRALKEAPAEDVRELYLTESFLARLSQPDRSLVDRFSCETYTITDAVMQKLSDTVHPQGVLAVVQIRRAPAEALFAGDAPLLLALENIQDPGNLGTIFRAAEGAGVTGLLLVGATADPYNPKVVRGTMGSIFRVPFARCADIREAAALLAERGVPSYAADVRAPRAYDACDYRSAAAFFIGNEGAGLSVEALAAADNRVSIPMAGAVESLNAGICAALLSFEAARQRRGRSL